MTTTLISESFDGYSSLEEKQLDIIESKDEYNEEMQKIKNKKEKLIADTITVCIAFKSCSVASLVYW